MSRRMSEAVRLQINGRFVTVAAGTTVAAAVISAGYTTFRRSVNGTSRGPLCGMGTCFECRLTIDGVPHERSCQLLCRTDMVVATDGE
jgi:sarcosine oxidase subunit alpha